ncbi:GNAT family N-acetyltransferase [Streptomyces caatingaensis]|uniref:GCN5 family acetyltransferase n=1 Tax=Streptomyces caatingaensis TaxID=1678637 RepID=A0A0K9XB29_9ACTN|nr:GNAT family N-acetyltransferase [Streptomyces caatingaensis]KNB50614.1 GCN5 family acetyltransferase [Streptomyces caatingaensis]
MNADTLTVRPLSGPDELALFCRLPYALNGELADDLARGRRRAGRMWVALRGGRLLARAAWWGRGSLLDVLDVDDALPAAERVDVGVRLLRAAREAVPGAGEYSRFVPPGWRDDPAVARAVEDRMAIARRAGARPFVERLRLEWRPGTPLPAPRGRLAFRPVRDAEELLDLMTAALEGTLDAYSRADLARMTAREAAVAHYEGEFARFTSPRGWWRVATLPGGEAAGFVIPARNDYNAIISYLAVLPAHRGRGYAGDLLGEGTRVLAHEGVPRVRAATDVANVPMADAFRRAGYAEFEREIVMTWRGDAGE